MIHEFINTDFKKGKHLDCVNKLETSQTKHNRDGVNLIVRAIITHENHILLTTATPENKNFPQNLFFLPGGHVEYNEPVLYALRREILEEMNLEFYNEEFVGALECSWDRKGSIYHELDIIYQIQIDGLDLNAPPKAMDHNFHRFVWKSLDEIDEIVILPKSLKTVIKGIERKTLNLLSEMI